MKDLTTKHAFDHLSNKGAEMFLIQELNYKF